jgi:hypothetical protein
MSALFVGQVADLAVNPFARLVLARGVCALLRARVCCRMSVTERPVKDIVVDEDVLRPAPNTVSHESACNAARGHLYRAFRAADTVERESLSASTTVHTPGPLVVAYMKRHLAGWASFRLGQEDLTRFLYALTP